MIYCKKVFAVLIILFICHLSQAQTSRNNLNKQINFCKEEVEQLEKEIDSYKQLLKEQYHKVTELKDTIVARESEKNALNDQIVDLQSASIILMEVAKSLEKQDKPLEALKIYQLIKEIYPGTLESSTSLYRIRKIYSELKKSESKKKKKK